jgi:hypothetical protein
MEALWTNISETRPSSDLASCIRFDRIKHMMLCLMKVLSLKRLSTRPPSVFYSIKPDTWCYVWWSTRPPSVFYSIKPDTWCYVWWRPCLWTKFNLLIHPSSEGSFVTVKRPYRSDYFDILCIVKLFSTQGEYYLLIKIIRKSMFSFKRFRDKTFIRPSIMYQVW